MHAAPFQPFVIRMADGREYRVAHPDFALAAENQESQVLIEEPDGTLHYLSPIMMTSVQRAPTATSA